MDATIPTPAVELPRPGDVLCDKYRIDALLGQGGMGIVMSAVDTTLGRPVAIKFLLPQKADDDGVVDRFLREARSAASIQSEHVVRIFDVGTFGHGTPFIVMEHLVGADLATVAARGQAGVAEACDWILQACEALGEAHARGIVHRDLKPANLFLSEKPDGTISLKILDFGISKDAADVASGQGPSLTSTGVVMGTPQYMSPEQVRSLRDVDARADVWALGAVLYELLAAAPIFQAPTAAALCAMIASDAPIPLRQHRPDTPLDLEAAIFRCLHKDPVGRFQDVAALAYAIAPFASERGRMSVELVSRVVRGSALPPTPGAGRVDLASMPFAPTSPRASGVPPTVVGPALPDPSAPFLATVGPPSSGHPVPLNAPLNAPPSARSGTSAMPGVLPPYAAPTGPPPASWPGGLPHVHVPSTPPTTQSGGWQQEGETRRPPARSAGLTVGILVLGLAVVAGGAYAGFRYTRHEQLQAAPPTPPPTEPASPAETSSQTAAPPPLTAPPPFVPAPPLGPAPAPHAKAQAEAICRTHNAALNAAATDAARAKAAEEAKIATCRGNASSRCERLTCLNACNTLKDAACVQQITNVIDHGPAAKY